MQQESILDLLYVAASEHRDRGLFIYPSGNVECARFVGYPELLRKAQRNASLLHQSRRNLACDSVVLLHFKNHLDNIEWFWSVLLARCIPAISTPFTNDVDQRKKHLLHLYSLLQDPLCLTREELVPEFMDQETLTVCTVENIMNGVSSDLQQHTEKQRRCPPITDPLTHRFDLGSPDEYLRHTARPPWTPLSTDGINPTRDWTFQAPLASESSALMKNTITAVPGIEDEGCDSEPYLLDVQSSEMASFWSNKPIRSVSGRQNVSSKDLLAQPNDLTVFVRPVNLGDQSVPHHDSLSELSSRSISSSRSITQTSQEYHDLAALMLTSGSTGNAKAVCLGHSQILKSIAGKSYAHNTQEGNTLLNWIALDHVASLVEVHLHAMYLGANQVHVHATDIVQSPLIFLELLSRHRVVFSFAPNFFLVKLKQAFEEVTRDQTPSARRFRSNLDLSCLQTLTSGGEANVVETCDAVTEYLTQYGASDSVISPGFGMTETCAGCIFNKHCPGGDLAEQREFAALGSCVPDVEMRVILASTNGTIKMAETNERGNLEVKGPIVFDRYYNNASATADAFDSDGWFKTGDQAFIDSFGHLNLVGRTKEIMIINGVKYIPRELEVTLEEASLPGVTPGFILAFSYRPTAGSHTEQICVVYLPNYTLDNPALRLQTNDAICKTTLLQTGVRPYVLPLTSSVLHKSTLGKLARAKIQAAFDRGDYASLQATNDKAISEYRKLHYEAPANDVECIILEECEHIFDLPKQSHELGVNDNIFDLGVTSIDLIRLQQRLQMRLHIADIPIVNIMTHPTIRSLAMTVKLTDQPRPYDPVIVLQSHGSKTPLWLIHPGVGEVLVFLALAKHMTERPVYALRARGFDGNEPLFANIAEAVHTYHTAIRAKQSRGPYAIAGYSYGSMLAFEVVKVLQAENDGEVRFLGAFNLPPHIKARMRQLDWTECLLHLAYFLELLSDTEALELSPMLHARPRHEVLAHVLGNAPTTRLRELGLDEGKLGRWADLALGLQSMAREYEPSGLVASIDVFYAVPLIAVARSKKEWRAEHLSRWADFSREPPRFHEVDGAHYTMLAPAHVVQFQRKLKAALRERGL